jgi:hypothetical protein
MTLKLLDHWPEFDRNDNLTGRRIIGIKADPIAVILKGPHHVEFLHLAKYAPDMLAALEEVDAYLAPEKGDDDVWHELRSMVQAAIAKAKGE